MRHSLEQIRRDLRGPIAPSPFANRRKQPKLDYCQRQYKIFRKWYDETGNNLFWAEMKSWDHKMGLVLSGKL